MLDHREQIMNIQKRLIHQIQVEVVLLVQQQDIIMLEQDLLEIEYY